MAVTVAVTEPVVEVVAVTESEVVVVVTEAVVVMVTLTVLVSLCAFHWRIGLLRILKCRFEVAYKTSEGHGCSGCSCIAL